MGVSVSASTAILLVAALVSYGMVFSAQDIAQDSIMDAQQIMTERQQNMLATSLEINQVRSFYNESMSFQYSNITVTNKGNTVLELNHLHLMVNGHFIGFAVVILPDGISSNLWVPGEVVVLVTTETDFRVDELNRVKVIAGNGVSDLKVYGGS